MAENEKFVIFQWPNKYLWAMIIAWPLTTYTNGQLQAGARSVFIVAVIIWSYEEIFHGANWFRKLLGFVVMADMLFNIFRLI